jgi:TetR/AcrR family transcriptional regulator, cholesterol catabolism regulator
VGFERTFDCMSPASTTPPRDAETKLQHILLHSAQIFAQQGFEGASIREISKATGVSLSGLYYYFESKQKLLYLLQLNAFTSILQSVQSRIAAIDDPRMRLRLLVENHVGYFLSHPNEMKVLAHEEEALEDPYRSEVAAIKRRYYDLAREIFEEVAGESVLATGLSSRIAVLSLFGMMNWIYKWHKPGVDPNADELSDTILKIFLHGTLSESTEEKLLSATGDRAVSRD